MGFASLLQESIDTVRKQINDDIIEVASELFTEVVNLSPAQPFASTSKGEFNNNWVAGTNEIIRSHTEIRSAVGAASKESINLLKGRPAFMGAKDGFVTLTNICPYSAKVEYTGWQKTKAYRPVRKAINLFTTRGKK